MSRDGVKEASLANPLEVGVLDKGRATAEFETPVPPSTVSRIVSCQPDDHSQSIILFYKYHRLLPSKEAMEPYRSALETLCRNLELKGRILVAHSENEGINGTLAGRSFNVRAFTYALLGRQATSFEPVKDSIRAFLQSFWDDAESFFDKAGLPVLTMKTPDDFKWSYASSKEPLFPDLNIKLVKEIIGTGCVLESIPIDETSKGYLTPEEWHTELANLRKDTVLIDCRNAKECAIGKFNNAIDPGTTNFSQFPRWVKKHQHELQDKRILMYCTGGVRCEKASAYVRQQVPGVHEVRHLKGGIHKYLEQYGSEGLWTGKNFVFDGRGAAGATETQLGKRGVCAGGNEKACSESIVGRCIYCQSPYDAFHPRCICTVCREPTLVCETCQQAVQEFHCRDHFHLRTCYFTNLTQYTEDELSGQLQTLHQHLDEIAVGRRYKQRRKTLQKQCAKIEHRLAELKSHQLETDLSTTCRSCGDTTCTGDCWGFHGLKRKERLLQGLFQKDRPTVKGAPRASRPSANQRVSKLQQQERSVREIQQLRLSRPPSEYRQNTTGIRVPPPCTRILESSVKGKWCGKQAVSVLREEFAELSREELFGCALEEGLLRLNNKPLRKETLATRLRNMDSLSRIIHWHEPPVIVPREIRVQRVPLPQSVMEEYGLGLDISCDEASVVLCDKPASVPVHPAGPYLSNSLTLMVEAQEQFEPRTLRPCHRIDRATSGLLICCRNVAVARLIQSKMDEGFVRKLYLARVKGRFPLSPAARVCFPNATGHASWSWIDNEPSCLEVNASVEAVDPANGIRVISAKGKPSSSRFQYVGYDPESDTSLVCCCPITGRGHQLRVHLQWLGFAICDDVQYGGLASRENLKAQAVSCIMESWVTENETHLESLSVDEIQAAKRACLCCTRGFRGIESSFTKAQLLGAGHAICLHALRYEIVFPRKKAKQIMASGDEKDTTLAVLQMEVDLPDWSKRFDHTKIQWL